METFLEVGLVNEDEDWTILCPEKRASVVVAMALLVIRSKQSEAA